MRRLLGVGAAGIIWFAAQLGAPALATAAPISDCTSSTGTIIAVDYAHWGGPVVRGCDTTNPKTGIALLNDAGFQTTGTQHDGPQFICRIGNQAYDNGTQYPTPTDDACVRTPPASAYWSFWLAPAGQSTWSYSRLGAYSDVPKAGEVELWIFGGTAIQGTAGNPTSGFPLCTPASLRAGGSPSHCSPVKTSGSGSSSGSGGSTSGGSGSKEGSGSSGGSGGSGHHGSVSGAGKPKPGGSKSGGSSAGGSTASQHRGSNAVPGSATGSGSHTADASASSDHRGGTASGRSASSVGAGAAAPSAGTASGPGGARNGDSSVLVGAKQASAKRPSAGSPVPLIVGISLAVVLAMGGGVTVWRRRSAD